MFYERVFFMVCFHEWNDSGCKMALIGSSKFAEKGMNWINCCMFYNNIYTQRIRIQMKGIVTNENITICLIANNWEQLKLRDFISCEWVDHELESTRLGEVVDSFPIFHLKIMIPLETPILERNKRSHWWNNDLVRASTRWSWVETWDAQCWPTKTLSWTKWKSIATCFIHESEKLDWYIGR